MASAGPLGEFQSGCREFEYVSPTTESTGTEYSGFAFLSFSLTVTVPSAMSTVASRSRRLSPSATTACASKRSGVVFRTARGGGAGASAGAFATVGVAGNGFAGAFGAGVAGSTNGGGASSSGGGDEGAAAAVAGVVADAAGSLADGDGAGGSAGAVAVVALSAGA